MLYHVIYALSFGLDDKCFHFFEGVWIPSFIFALNVNITSSLSLILLQKHCSHSMYS